MHTTLTAPQLFAGVIIDQSWTNRCFFCGGLCGEAIPAKSFVKSSFTGLDTVTLSDWVCVGCVQSQDERATITLADGQVRDAQKTRGYSWVFNHELKVAATKSHRAWLLDQCLHPPAPPYAICISDSGQKHLLYRAVVNHVRDPITVTLEGMPVTYFTHQLISRLQLCKRICASIGKLAMSEAMNPQTQMRILDYHDDEPLLVAWLDCSNESLTQLATWLCPPKEECAIEYPGAIADTRHTPTQATFGWVD